MRRLLRFAAAGLLVLAGWAEPPVPVRAAAAHGIGPPAAPSGGVVGKGNSLICSESALDSRLAGGGTVTFACGGPWTIHITSPKVIAADTTIIGGDSIVLTGDGNWRLFEVNSGVTLRLQHIVLDGGFSGPSDGGAISSDGALVLEDSTIQNSRTDNNHSGGAIFSSGPVTITNSTLTNNNAGSAGALFANYANALVTISHSTFSNNQANNTTTGYGGAIWAGEQAQLTITDSGLITNTANVGGALYLSPNAVVTVTGNSPMGISGNSATTYGGGIFSNQGTATLTNVAVSDNSAAGGGGGGLYNHGTVTLTNVVLSGNSATTSGGGIYSDFGTVSLTNSTVSSNSALTNGGGLLNYGTATLTNTTLSGNSALYGGGIYSEVGMATLANSTVYSNTSHYGGGLYNSGRAILTNATLSGNSAWYGGGLLNYGTATLANSTVYSNSALEAGGIDNGGTVTLTNATLSDNSADVGGGIYQSSTDPALNMTLENTIIAHSLAGANCSYDLFSVGSIYSDGYNLSSDGTCVPFFNRPSDLANANPNLGPLANNGGPTLTLMPHLPSQAIDAIPPGVNGCGTTLTTDQRGVPRPYNSQCDIGAVEATWPYPRLWLPLVRR